jgi:hypothetical protein
MEHLQIPLNDAEEAVLELLKQVEQLKLENIELRQIIKELKWSMIEHD